MGGSTKVLLGYKMFWLNLFFAFMLIQSTEPGQSSASSSSVKYSSRIVETRSGPVRGIVVDPERKRLGHVEIFKSIPYAKPPMGELRFEPARKIEPWKEILYAERFGPVCPQTFPSITNKTASLTRMPKGRYDELRRIVTDLQQQDENCLTLNIYVPDQKEESPYAVLFFIHGESFEWGSGNLYDGTILSSYGNIIVVTLNYRLGILGFAQTQSHTSTYQSDNLAITDIFTALEWIHDNIRAFGGDNRRITLVGHSGGAALVHYLLISNISKGLFQRTILMSGSILSPWARIISADLIIDELSKQLACHLTDSNVIGVAGTTRNASSYPESYFNIDISECLKKKPLEALMGVRLPFIRFRPTWGLHPTIDPEFIMEHAGENFITTEMILGFTTMESYNDFTASEILYGLEEEQRNRLIKTFVQNTYDYHLNEIYAAVKNEYTDWDKSIVHPINTRDATMEALSDGHTTSQLIKIAYLHAKRGAKTYLYHFAHLPNQGKTDPDHPQKLGTIHGEDLAFLFGAPLALKHTDAAHGYNKQDVAAAEAILTYFTNFCKTGDPNESGNRTTASAAVKSAASTTMTASGDHSTRFKNVAWQPYERMTQQYLSFTSKTKMKTHYRGHKMALWLNLIPQLHVSGGVDISERHHQFNESDLSEYYGVISGVVRKNVHHSDTRPSSNSNLIRHNKEVTVECVEEPVLDGEPNVRELSKDEDDNLLLQKLADRHYSYAAGITFSVGCLLLILNMLIFAAIYYQRQVSSTNASRQCVATHQQQQQQQQQQSQQQQQQTPDLMQPTTSIPSYYITDCDSLDLSRIEKCINKTRDLERSGSHQLNNYDKTEVIGEKIEVPQRTGILRCSSSSDDGRGTLKPKKRVQIQTDVSIV